MEVFDVNSTVTVSVPVLAAVKPYELTLTTGNRKIISFKSEDLEEDATGSYVTVSFDGRRLGPGVLGYVIYDDANMWWSSLLHVELRRVGTYGRYGHGSGDYARLRNKPKINGVELVGDKSSSDLNIGNEDVSD